MLWLRAAQTISVSNAASAHRRNASSHPCTSGPWKYISCSIFRDTQASPCLSSAPMQAVSGVPEFKVASRQLTAGGLPHARSSQPPLKPVPSDMVSLPKPLPTPLPRPGSLTRKVPELPGASGNNGQGVLYLPARQAPTQGGSCPYSFL